MSPVTPPPAPDPLNAVCNRSDRDSFSSPGTSGSQAMEQTPFQSRSSPIALTSIFYNHQKDLLPLSTYQKPKLRVRALLSHCLYRRVVLWAIALLLVLLVLLTTGGARLRRDGLLDLVELNPDGKENDGDPDPDPKVVFVVTPGTEKPPSSIWGINMPNWLQYRYLDGYFTGLKALVPARNYTPEYPRKTEGDSPFPVTLSYTGLPTPTPFVPQPDYQSEDYTARYHEVEPCYLDKEKTVPVPDLYAYNGLVQGQPEPFMGSYNLLGLRDDICFDRFGRYGPYGLGYSFEEGGSEVGLDTEREGSEVVWEKTGKINYDKIDWGDAQARCYEANKKRFRGSKEQSLPSPTRSVKKSGKQSAKHSQRARPEREHPEREHPEREHPEREHPEREHPEREKIPRTAVVVRAYTGFPWSEHGILNFRAMISELALRSGAEYTVHFLLHVRDDREAIWADPLTAQRVLDDNLPQEFHSITTLWSEAQMRLVYPADFGRSFSDPSGADIHGVYRSAHMPLQHFAMSHPEYTHFWNWELDIRYTGNYYELFDRLGAWAKKQSRIEMWERSAKYYIPGFHGDWGNFTRLVHNETVASGRAPILGPVSFPGRIPLRSELRGESFLPPSCTLDSGSAAPSGSAPTISPQCGVGEDADLITLNPIFDTDESGWVFASDVTGYKNNQPIPPRRCAIVTAGRYSRRLLETMHEENWRLHHTMFSEMFPPTMALHHGLKAVYAPHPLYVDRDWDLDTVDKAFNGGRDHSTSGHGSPYDWDNEHNHKGTSWYYNSEFSGLLWRRWLGYAQFDGRGANGGRAGEGKLRGGPAEEGSTQSTGRLCLRSMLVHPVKWEHPSEIEG